MSKWLDIEKACCLLLFHLAEARFPFELCNLVLCLFLVCFAVSLLALQRELVISRFIVCFAVSLLTLKQPVALLIF
jgi:hypothetical protein